MERKRRAPAPPVETGSRAVRIALFLAELEIHPADELPAEHRVHHEQRRVLEISKEELELPIVNGVYADGSLEAARIARMATDGGAAALLVFPPAIYSFGQRPEMAVAHFKRIADATDVPLILFQYPLAGGQGYPLATLEKIFDAVPSVKAIKDWCANPQLHERQIRVLQSRSVNVLTTHSSWLLSSLVLGCAGLLSGSGSVIAGLQAELFAAVRNNDLKRARELHDRITPTAEVFYAEPWVDMHNRMKEALVLLGRLPRAVVRPPLTKISAEEIARIRAALVAAGLLETENQRRRVA